MVAKKLDVLLIQEPGLLSGIEEDVKFIYLEMINCLEMIKCLPYSDFTEHFRDFAYDMEDFIKELTLKSAATKKRSGGVHKKLEKIKVKINVEIRPLTGLAFGTISTETVEDQNMAQTFVSPVIEKLTDLLAQASLRSQVKKKARRMEDEFKLIERFLDQAESVEWDNSVMEWLEELCNVSCEAVGVINLFINRKAHVRGNKGAFRRVVTAFDKIRSHLRLGGEMDRINARLQDLCERMPQQVVGPSLLGRIRSLRSSFSTDDSYIIEEPDVISFNDDVEEIVARLLTDDKSFLVISIVGMEGIGKTTLAKLVYDKDAVVHHFPFRAWTFEKMFVLDFLKDILKSMDPNKSIPTLWKEGDNNSREEDNISSAEEELWSLFNAFVKDKKCLIVVDNVYCIRNIDKLRTGFSATSSGSRMILILNHPSLLSRLPKKDLHLTLQPRDDNESWALFTHILKLTIPPELQSLRGDIVKTCCGVPLIIKKLAAVLSRKDTTIEEWSGVLQQFNGDQELGIDDRLPTHMKRSVHCIGLDCG